MRCINSTLSLFNSSVKAKGPVNDLSCNKQSWECKQIWGMRCPVQATVKLLTSQERYRNVIINGFGDPSNHNFETTSSNFLQTYKEKYFPTSIRCSQFKLLPSMKLILSSDQMKGRKLSYLPRSYRKPARKKFNLFHQLLIFYEMEFTSYITDAPFWVPSPPIM